MWQPGMKGQAWGLSGAFKGELPEQRFIAIDAAAMTAINQWDGDKSKLDWVNALPSSLVYRLTQNPNVLLIGPGGGVDVLVAWANDAKKITAAEINPLIVDLMRNKYRQYSGGLYSDIPQIDVQVAEGRNFVARSQDKYDVIQFSQVDTWAAAAAGAYSLTENYLYTLDAYKEYLSHLNPDGLLAIGRWHFEPPGQALRLVTIGSAALKSLGVADPSQHFMVVRVGDTANMFMKKSPFTVEEIAAVRAAADPLFFTVLYAPDMVGQEGNHFADFFRATDKQAFYAKYPARREPDHRRPAVLLRILRLDQLRHLPQRQADADDPADPGCGPFPCADPLAALAVPQGQGEHGRHPPLHRLLRGVGHRVHLHRDCADAAVYPVPGPADICPVGGPVLAAHVLGHRQLPVRKTRAPDTDTRRVPRFVIPGLAALVVVYMLALPPVFHSLLGWDIGPRVLLSVVLIAPLGLLMGMPFPLGMRLVAATNEPLVPWAWGVNGCASVLGSIMSVMLAQSWGFTVVLWHRPGRLPDWPRCPADPARRGPAGRIRVAGMNRRAGCGQYVLFEVQHVGAGSPCPRLK